MSSEGGGGIEESSTEPSSSKSQPSTSSPTPIPTTRTRTTNKPAGGTSTVGGIGGGGGAASIPVIPTSQQYQQHYQHQQHPQPQHTPSRTPAAAAEETTTTTSKPPDHSTSETTYPSTPEDVRPKQVIAVNASKGPAAFFNLARKFLVADEICDLSALEGAIVSAADAAHLLERSQLATIVRVQTSYAAVEPKRRRQQPGSFGGRQQQQQQQQQQQGRELRRARIVITVKRTEQYKRWLDENPYQAVLAGDGVVEEEEATTDAPSTSYVR